jgi:hypothetical protein
MSFTDSQAPLPDEMDGAGAEPEDQEVPDDVPASPWYGVSAPDDELPSEDHPEPTAEIPAANPYSNLGDPIHPDDLDDEWAVQKRSRGLRVGVITGVLLLLLAAGGGFWGGAAAEKSHAASSSSSSNLSRLVAAARAAAGSGTSGSSSSPFGRGGFGAAATGTVIGVNGDVLEISDSSGNIVKVTVGPTATVTRTSSVPLSGLKVGDTVVVTGSTGSKGSVTATAVRASASGTSTGAGGFAGFGGAPSQTGSGG